LLRSRQPDGTVRARFRTCPRRWCRTSGCSRGRLHGAGARAPAGGASGCAAPPPPTAWIFPGRRCACPVPRRFPWGSWGWHQTWAGLERFDDVILVGVDAELPGDLQGFLDDVGGGKVGGLQQGTCRRLGVGAARTDGGDAVFGLQDVAV